MKPDYAAVWSNMGLALNKLSEEAVESNMPRSPKKYVNGALELDPSFEDAQILEYKLDRSIRH